MNSPLALSLSPSRLASRRFGFPWDSPIKGQSARLIRYQWLAEVLWVRSFANEDALAGRDPSCFRVRAMGLGRQGRYGRRLGYPHQPSRRTRLGRVSQLFEEKLARVLRLRVSWQVRGEIARCWSNARLLFIADDFDIHLCRTN
jgi:hypothetical protein